MAHRDLIVVGTSAGGIETLRQLLRGLPPDLAAPVLIVLHTTARSGTLVPRILARASALPACHPCDRTPIEPGKIYVAPPNLHMLVSGNQLRVLPGPRENLHRPAIDPLFRSAAVSRGRRVIGVILSGLLDDGTSGLMSVQAHGGAAIVQDPETALFSEMPHSALERVPSAQVLPVERIAEELVRLTREELPAESNSPAQQPGETVSGAEKPEQRVPLSNQPHADRPTAPHPPAPLEAKETRFLENQVPQLSDAERPGHPSTFGCPECGGVLWEINDRNFLRFRCRVGHAYTAKNLEVEQQHTTDVALWSALRSIEESATLYHRMTEQAIKAGQSALADRFRARALHTEENGKSLRDFLSRIETRSEPPC